jgi:DNA uptake protein ComE-like DNA-binding protein
MITAPKSRSTAFTYLTLGGTTVYSIDGDRVHIEIGEIYNLNENGFLSGTLSVELWALPKAYKGKEFSGFPLASTTIGELSSQHYLSNCRYDLNYQQPPEGEWYFTLMLREWDGNAYITRDFVNFQMPVRHGSVSDKAESKVKSSNVFHLAFTSANETHSDGEKQVLHAAGFEEKVQIQKPKKSSKKVKISRNESNLLSRINKSNVDDFLSIKGIFKSLAEDIKAGQPYKEENDLLKIKGLGKKKFEVLLSSLNSSSIRNKKSK